MSGLLLMHDCNLLYDCNLPVSACILLLGSLPWYVIEDGGDWISLSKIQSFYLEPG
jgi:hypothetical protein